MLRKRAFLCKYIDFERNKVKRSTAVMGILYTKGIIKDRSSIKELNATTSLRKKFKSEEREERKEILQRLENGELDDMNAIDIIKECRKEKC